MVLKEHRIRAPHGEEAREVVNPHGRAKGEHMTHMLHRRVSHHDRSPRKIDVPFNFDTDFFAYDPDSHSYVHKREVTVTLEPNMGRLLPHTRKEVVLMERLPAAREVKASPPMASHRKGAMYSR